MRITSLNNDRLLDCLALVAGALLPLAFAPYSLFPLAIISPALLYYSWQNSKQKLKPRRAFMRGWLYGIGMFGVGVSWIFVSIHQFGNTSISLAAIITGLFIALLALFPAIQGYFLTKFFPHTNNSKLLLAFPASWVLLEWIRSWLFTGLPWLLLCYSQTNSPLRGYVAVIGGYGLSFLVVLSSALLLAFIEACRKKAIKKILGLVSLFALIWVGGIVLDQVHWTKPQGKALKVSLIQGNVPQQLKWSEAYLNTIITTYRRLTAKHWDSDIIIWPEGAIPVPLPNAKPFVGFMDQLAKQHHSTLITGIPVREGFNYYNAMIALGDGSGHYYKRHLVPFGEYVPFDTYLRGVIGLFNLPMSNFIKGPDKQDDLLADGIAIAPFICYEIAYPDNLLKELPQAKLMVTVSDDAWFGNSFAPAQHLQIAQMRARQVGRFLLFSTNNGITAIINPQGRIVQQTPQFQEAVLTRTIQPMSGSTPWLSVGNTIIIIVLFLMLLVGYCLGINPK